MSATRGSLRAAARSFRRPRHRLLLLGLAATFAAAGLGSGCATPEPADHARRAEAATNGLEDDPAVQASEEELEAARQREAGEPVLEEVEIRVRNEDRDGHRLRLTTRVPVPNPDEVRARREVRRAETGTSLAKLEETALGRRADRCFLEAESAAYRARVEIYESWARWQRRLLDRNDELARSGSLRGRSTTEFELESMIRLATRSPGPEPVGSVAPGPSSLPPLAALAPGGPRLVNMPARVREAIRLHNPSFAVHAALAERYDALTERARARRMPWFDFVDLSYEPIARNSENEYGAQVAVRIPIGEMTSGDLDRYQSLGRSELRRGEQVVEQQLRDSLAALNLLDHFETQSSQWRDLLELAGRAEELAESGWEGRVVRPDQVSALVEKAYDARAAVLEARVDAGLARCSLLSLTGIPLEAWPRE